MVHIRMTLVALLASALLGLGGCGASLSPRTSTALPWKAWAESGAMVDASRAHPVAFWADPSREPTQVAVGSTTFYPGQWLTHLALRMNQAIQSKTLLDTRFSAVSPKLFAWELSAGHYTYTYRGKRADTEALVARSRARAAELRFVSANVVKLGADNGVRLLVKVVMGSSVRSYAVETDRTGGWDTVCMDLLARKILGDAGFWDTAKSQN